MDTLPYPIGSLPVNSTPLKGRYLSRSLNGNGNEADFVGAALYLGTRHLTEPSLKQCGLIVGRDVTSIWWAVPRLPFRAAILAGEMPLVPPRKKPAPPVPIVNDAAIVDFVRRIGVGACSMQRSWSRPRSRPTTTLRRRRQCDCR